MENNNTVETILNIFSSILPKEDILYVKLTATISAILKQSRIALDMSIQEFADYINVSESDVTQWECASYNFDIQSMSRIFNKLGFDIDISFIKKEN